MCLSLGVDALHNSLPAVAGQLGTIKPRSVRRSGTFYHHPGLDTNYGPTHDAETIAVENVSHIDLYQPACSRGDIYTRAFLLATLTRLVG